MKQTFLLTLAGTAAMISLAACVQVPTENTPQVQEQFPLRATITPDNHCTVEALGKTYTSVGQVRGAVLPNFTGTSEGGGRDGWHVVGCWVSNVDGSDGDLVIVQVDLQVADAEVCVRRCGPYLQQQRQRRGEPGPSQGVQGLHTADAPLYRRRQR